MMGKPLDEKGLEAARGAYDAAFPDAWGGITYDGMEVAIRAYLSAIALPDGMEVMIRHQHETVGVTPALREAKALYDEAQPIGDGMEVVAWRHTLHMDGGEAAVRLARADVDRPWGKPGIDFDSTFTVTIEPLVTLSQAQSALAAMRVERDDAMALVNYAEDVSKRVQSDSDLMMRALKAEAQVQRLTEENEALRGDRDKFMAIAEDKLADTRLVNAGARGEGFGFDFSGGPIPYITEYLFQFIGGREPDGPSNYAEIEVQHNEFGAMTLTLQRRSGKTPHQLRQAAEARIKALEEALGPFANGWLDASHTAVIVQDKESSAAGDARQALIDARATLSSREKGE